MKIAISTRLLTKNLEGIGIFTLQVFNTIAKKHPEHDFTFIFDRPFNKEFIQSKNINGVVLGPPTRHPLIWEYWLRFPLKRFLKKGKFDAFIAPDGFLCNNTNINQYSVIHDLNFIEFPKAVKPAAKIFYTKKFPTFVKQAKKVFTVSEYSKQQIIKYYNCPKEKIKVIYSGVTDRYKPITESEKAAIKKEYADNNDFFLFTGAISPRKNVANLIKAFALYKSKTDDNTKLVLAGRTMYKNSEISKAIEESNCKSDIITLGFVHKNILPKIMASAKALCMVSLYEGFGVPPLEAMASHTPVIASNTTAIPEICGKAALYVNPKSVEEISNAMIKINENSLTETLISEGKIQYKKFTWQRTADLLIEEIIESKMTNK